MKTTSTVRNNVTGLATATVITAALLLAFSASNAQRESRPSLDADGDGYISEEEYVGRIVERLGDFSDVDTDGDGQISEEELRTRVKEKRAGRSKRE